jgi:phosphopantothenate---cysteine ligase (CTP)
MRCIVTAGPSYQPIDEVRRLTNFSTGRLGTQLAEYLLSKGYSVHLFRGSYSTYRSDLPSGVPVEFTTPVSLLALFRSHAVRKIDVIFHAAAIGDFQFGNAWTRAENGTLKPVTAGKLPSRQSGLLVELVPTEKVILQLRRLYPSALIVGWKYEVDGGPQDTVRAGKRQLEENDTDLCVLNGPAYGKGFGILTKDGSLVPHEDAGSLFRGLERFLRSARPLSGSADV